MRTESKDAYYKPATLLTKPLLHPINNNFRGLRMHITDFMPFVVALAGAKILVATENLTTRRPRIQSH